MDPFAGRRGKGPESSLTRRVRRGPAWFLRLGRALLASESGPGSRVALGPGPALLVICGFMIGSVAGVTLDQLDRDAARRAHIAAVAAERAHQERVSTAATERLSGQATLYFARRRTEALDAAQAAVTEAGLVRASVSPVVGDAALAPLDEALTALSALVGEVPSAPAVLQVATATVAAAVPLPVPELAVVAPTTPGADVLSLVAEATSSRDGIGRREDSSAAATEASALTAAASSASTTASPTAVGAVGAPGTTPLVAAGSSEVSGPPAAAAASPPVTVEGTATLVPPVAPSSSAAAAAPSSSAPAQTSPAAALADAAAGGLDVTVSNKILGLVEEIRARAVEVQATADAMVAAQQAEAEARAAAEAAAQAAATRAARTMRTRIAATVAAPNGEIPTVLLCGVTFSKGVLLRCDAATMLEQMNAAYRAETGKNLVIASSYRTTAEQEVLRATKGELAAVAGTSNHGRALAIDLAGAGNLGQFDAPVYLWLVANAGTYGWHHPVYMEPGGAGPLEPWHWEYDTD